MILLHLWKEGLKVHRNIVDELLGSLNVSILKTRLDTNLSEKTLICENNNLVLNKQIIKNRDLKRLINLCMVEGDLNKMKVIGEFLLLNNKELIKTLNIYEVISTGNLDCICLYAKSNKSSDEFYIKLLIEAMIETQSIDDIILFLAKGGMVNKTTERLILETDNEDLILAYSSAFETEVLMYQNKLIELSKKNKKVDYIIKFYMIKKPVFFNNIEDTILRHQFDRSNIDLVIDYLLENKNARRILFDEKITACKDELIKSYYFMALYNLEMETDLERFENEFKLFKYTDKCMDIIRNKEGNIKIFKL